MQVYLWSRILPLCFCGLLVPSMVGCQSPASSVPCDATGSGVAVEPGTLCPEENPFCHSLVGLCWSNEQQGLSLAQAQTRCTEMQGALPSITHLRSLFVECPATEPEGACTITETCSASTCEIEACSGCGDGGLNVFGNENIFWSSTSVSDVPGEQFVAVYRYGMVTSLSTDGMFSAYCVQPAQ